MVERGFRHCRSTRDPDSERTTERASCNREILVLQLRLDEGGECAGFGGRHVAGRIDGR